ncbi:MAG: hypothetical protein LBT42_04920 [Tannerella sp.]|jgi:hypothetical protein|nr:hypothetical protein [Tannerella sp.]
MQLFQALELEKGYIDVETTLIDNEIMQHSLIIDFGISETKAADIYYSSKTFTLLADESTDLYRKSWLEIYKMLKKELMAK